MAGLFAMTLRTPATSTTMLAASQKHCDLILSSAELLLSSVAALRRSSLPYTLPFYQYVHLRITLCSQVRCVLSVTRKHTVVDFAYSD